MGLSTAPIEPITRNVCWSIAPPIWTVRTVTAAFQQHYHDERPHQGLACDNQPPRVAFPSLPSRPPVPVTIDPDRSLAALDGHAYMRKVRQDTSVTIGASSYYTAQALVGHYVTLRIDARDSDAGGRA